MGATIEIVVSLILFLLLFGILGAFICGIYYKKKQQPFLHGLFLGGVHRPFSRYHINRYFFCFMVCILKNSSFPPIYP